MGRLLRRLPALLDDGSITRARLATADEVGWGSILVDGVVWGLWRVRDDELLIRHVDRPGRRAASAEAKQLLRFLDAQAKIRFESV